MSEPSSQPSSDLPRFLNAGECALIVEYGASVDPHVHERVMSLNALLTEAAPNGVLETVPTYRSLMVHYDPLLLPAAELIAAITRLHPLPTVGRRARDCWIIPVCYAADYSMDLAYVAATLKLTKERVVALHAGATYRLYMYGFAPGLGYLGGLPPELTISRRAEPRAKLDANKAIIAGGQAAITTVPMPNGWHVLGETAEALFNPVRDPVFLLTVADDVRFEAVDALQFQALKMRAQTGEVVAQRCSVA